jgi:hypothetical protein
MRADDPATPHIDPEVPLEKQVQRYRPWYRRERHAAAALVGLSIATIAGSAMLFGWTLSLGRFGDPPDEEAPPLSIAPSADEMPTALLAADEPVGVPDDRVARPIEGSAVGVSAAVDEYGVIAVWTERVVWVSRDDGRTFHQELAAPQPLTAVAVGDSGRVYAARHGGRIDLLTPSGRTSWIAFDADQVLSIDASSAWLAVLGLHADRQGGLSPLLWLSHDHGSSWQRLVVPHHGDTANQVRVSPTGVIHLLTLDSDTDVDGDRVGHYAGHVDGRPFERVAGGELQPFGLDRAGQTWSVAGGATPPANGRPRARLGSVQGRPGGAPHSLASTSWDVHLASSRGRTIAAADGRLLDLDGDRPQVVAARLPGAINALAVDGLGRSLVLVGGSLFRHSARHGWRLLFAIPPP